METADELTRRVDDLTVRLIDLEHRLVPREQGEQRAPTVPASADGDPADGGPADGDRFWVLHGLKERLGETGAVLFSGVAPLPTGETYEWQEGHLTAELLDRDWERAAAALGALAHPVRLTLLRSVLHGARTTAELQAAEGLGTSGQFYHHVRQLTAAGWLRLTSRGHYAVPPERVVPLLAILAGADR
jgi:hypothetical protein